MQQRIARAPADRVRAVRPRDRRRGRDRPVPALAGRPAPRSRRPPPPYPTVPTLILQGGEDLRTPPEWSARVAARIPGAHRIVDPRRRPLDRQRPARLRGRSDPAVRARPHAAEDVQARADRRARGAPAAPASFESLRGVPGLPAQGRPDAAGGRGDDRRPRLVLSPAALTDRRRRPARRLVGDRAAAGSILRDYQAVTGVTVTGHGSAGRSGAHRGHQGRARHASRSPAPAHRTLGGRRISVRSARHADAAAAPPPCAPLAR